MENFTFSFPSLENGVKMSRKINIALITFPRRLSVLVGKAQRALVLVRKDGKHAGKNNKHRRSGTRMNHHRNPLLNRFNSQNVNYFIILFLPVYCSRLS